MKSIIHFRHYTSLASLVHILTHKKITLSDPSNWEDKNDSIFLEYYSNKMKFQSLFAICFTTTHETAHHWKIYAPGKHGVCIKLDALRIIDKLNTIPEIRHDKVEYKLVKELEGINIIKERLPFLKRKAFCHEEEYRVIYQNVQKTKRPFYELPIDLSWIVHIYLNHSIPKVLEKSVRDLLHSINGCSEIMITRTSLNENTEWKKIGLSAT